MTNFLQIPVTPIAFLSLPPTYFINLLSLLFVFFFTSYDVHLPLFPSTFLFYHYTMMTEVQTHRLWTILNSHRSAWQLLSGEYTLDVNSTNPANDGETPMHFAAEHADVALAMVLYTKGADVNAIDQQGQSPLHKAARTGNYQLVSFLIKAGADASTQDVKGKRASFYASSSSSSRNLLSVAEVDPARAKEMAKTPAPESSEEQEPTKGSLRKTLSGLEGKLAKAEVKLAQARLITPKNDKNIESLVCQCDDLRGQIERQQNNKAQEGDLKQNKRNSLQKLAFWL